MHKCIGTALAVFMVDSGGANLPHQVLFRLERLFRQIKVGR